MVLRELDFFGPGSICGLGGKFHLTIHIAHSRWDHPSFASACFTELLTFIANHLLNAVTKVGGILGVLLVGNVQIAKIQSYVETVFPSLPHVFIQIAG